MTKAKVQALPHGLYEVRWKKSSGGGTSLAAVGTTADGIRWLAPTNWVTVLTDLRAGRVWRDVQSVQRIQ